MTQYSNIMQMKSLYVEPCPNANPCVRIHATVLASLLFAFQALVFVMYGLYMNYPIQATNQYDQYGVTMLFFLILLLLVGFGLLLTYIRTTSWSGLGYTLFILAISIQLYLLIQAFWTKAQIQPSWQNFLDTKASWIGLTPLSSIFGGSFTNAVQSAIAVYVSYSAIHGRISPLQVFLHTIVTVIAFQLNRQVLVRINCQDAGGSMGIFLFGSMSGIVVSWILGVQRMHLTDKHYKYRSERMNMGYALLGTMFIWSLLPVVSSVNSLVKVDGQLANPYITAGVINMWFALSASTWAAFCTSILLHKKASIHDIVFGTFSGGIAFGSSANLVMNPVGPIIVGIIAGVISSFLLTYLQSHMNRGGVLDSNGIVGTFMFSGFQGGLWAGVFMVFSGLQQYYTYGYTVPNQNNQYYHQGGIEIAGTFISAGIGTVAGFFSCAFLRPINKMEVEDFFDDGTYWTIEDDGLHTFFDGQDQQSSNRQDKSQGSQNSQQVRSDDQQRV